MTDNIHKTILIVEDESIIALDIKSKLSRWNFEVIGVAANSEKAHRLVRKQLPDIILMDINIGGDKDGIQTAEELLRHYAIQIIFMTGFTNKEYRDRAMKLNPAAFFPKPINFKSLQNVLNSL